MTQARHVAEGVKLNDLVAQMQVEQRAPAPENPLLVPNSGDTARSKPVPAKP